VAGAGASQQAGPRTIAEQSRLTVHNIAAFRNRLTRDEAQRHYERNIGRYFTPDGQVDLNNAQQAIDAVESELGAGRARRACAHAAAAAL
jgi:hypothetical protein